MAFLKANLVTRPDGSDLYNCDKCGFRKKYRELRRPKRCPRCHDTGLFGRGAPPMIYGLWCVKGQEHFCGYCRDRMIRCPKNGHPNSRFWYLQRVNDEELQVCPNGCHEDGKHIAKPAEGALYYRLMIVEERLDRLEKRAEAWQKK